MSSMVAIESSLSTAPIMFSALAARAKVALFDMVSTFMIGTLPKSKLKMSVELSALLTASQNFTWSGFVIFGRAN
jgi:hypothetical protein